MKKKIILRLDPWSQIALWLLVILLATDRLRSFSPVGTAHAQENSGRAVIAVNLAEIGGSKVDPIGGLPVRLVGPPPSNRIGPNNFPFQKVQE